jgi:hypothetical protein
MYKIVVCDLDETLISMDRTITKENVEAIKAAAALGVKFVPTTGRGYNSVTIRCRSLDSISSLGSIRFPIMAVPLPKIKMKSFLYFQGITFEEAEAIYQRGSDI